MSDLEQAARQALDALERYQVKRQDFDRFADEVTALRAALAKQAEPVAIPGAIPMAEVAAKSRAMPERAAIAKAEGTE